MNFRVRDTKRVCSRLDSLSIEGLLLYSGDHCVSYKQAFPESPRTRDQNLQYRLEILFLVILGRPMVGRCSQGAVGKLRLSPCAACDTAIP